MAPIYCRACRERFSIASISDDKFRALQDAHYFEYFSDELQMLLKVKAFYARDPGAEEAINPDLIRVIESNDPAVRKQRENGVPLDQIDLPPIEFSPRHGFTAADEEAVEYLKRHAFALKPRLRWVKQQVNELQGNFGFVACPKCKRGRLAIDGDQWDGDVIE